MKRHNTVKVVLIALLAILLLTWILPAAYYQGQYVDQGRVQMGIFDLFSYPTVALSYFGFVALFVLVVGGFYGILNKIGAYRKLLDGIANKFKKHGILALSIMMVLIAAMVSICGLQLGLLLFVPFIIAIILLMGYDKIVAALTVVGSTMIGLAGTTYAYQNTSVLVSTLGVKLDANLLFKLIILVGGLTLLILNTVLYIKKAGTKKTTTKKTTKKTDTKKAAAKTKSVFAAKLEDYVPAATKTKSSVAPLAVILIVMFVIMILSFIPWTGAFGVKAFDQAKEAVVGFKVFDFALFGKILGNVNAFGSWGLAELITTIVMLSGLLVIIYKVKFNDALQAFITGAKRALEPAVLIVLIYTCLVAATYHPFQLTIYKFLLGLTKGFNVFTVMLSGILASVLNADPLYAFQSVVPYFSSIVTSHDAYKTVSVVLPAVYGLTMLVAPTSIVLMSVLSYLGISYKDWFKNIWKLLLMLLGLILIVSIVLILI